MADNNSAINIFDFDGTLTTETWPKFLVWVKKFGYTGEKRNNQLESAIEEYRKNKNGDELETFFGFFNDLLIKNNETIIFEELMEGEKYISYNEGVMEFIEKSLEKNYIVSGGIKEFLEGLKIAKYFYGIYGTPIKQNQKGIYGIGDVMTNDKKILAICEILRENNKDENDCSNVYYIGDGWSDVDAMSFIHRNGGKSVFVYQEDKKDVFHNYNMQIYNALKAKGIVDFCCVADYREGSELSNILKRQRKKEDIILEER